MRLFKPTLLLLLALSLCAVVHADNSVAVDSTSQGNTSALGSSSTSWTHTMGTGSNGYLLVCVMGATAPTSQNTPTVTYNGTSMTLINSSLVAGGGINALSNTWLFGLLSPSTGSNTVSVSTNTGTIGGWSTSYTGVSGTGNSSVDPTNGPTTSSPANLSEDVSYDHSWRTGCTPTPANVSSNNSVTNLEVKGFAGGWIADTGVGINPDRTFGMSFNFDSAHWSFIYLSVELYPTNPSDL